MLISWYVCLFILYSFLGWIYETLFCIITSRHWSNRGFLYGPICPIYGAGVVLLTLLVRFVHHRGMTLSAVSIFMVSVIGSALLEYATSYVLEEVFHATWWDYSHLPLNFNGRISLFTSLGFGVGGIFVYYFLIPFAEHILNALHPLGVEGMSLVFVGIFSADLTLTITALVDFNEKLMYVEDSFNKNMELIIENAIGSMNHLRRGSLARIRLFRYRNKTISDNIRNILERVKRN